MENISNYFEYLTGLKPTEDQVKVLKKMQDKKVKKIIVTAGRQSGKTLTTAVGVMWWLFESREKVKILLVSAQDNILYFHMREIFKMRPELETQLTDISKLSPNIIPLRGFELKNGSIIFVRGSTEKNLRGIPADIVVIDEACEVKNDNILTGIGNITGPIAKLILLSTPHIATSLFVKWATEESGFEVIQWSAENLSWHDSIIEKTKKKEFSHEKYAVEVLGRPPTKAERQFFPNKHIDECIMTVDSIREGGVNSRVEVGVDWGDALTVLIVTERIGTTKRKVLFCKTWKATPPEQLGPEVLEITAKFGSAINKCDSKPEAYYQWFRFHAKNKMKSIDFALGHKDQMLGQLQRMIREHRIIIPHEYVDLVTALRKYRRTAGKDSKSPGSDYVEALALSIYEPAIPLESESYGRVHFPSKGGYIAKR